MKTCSRCGRPDAPGSSIPKDRNTCNPCRKGHAPTAAPAPRDPVTIITENRRRAEAARREVEFASMANYVERLERDLAAVRVLQAAKPMAPIIVKAPKKIGQSEVVPLVVLSDWHAESEVDPAKMHGLNAYNLEIAKRRSEVCFENASKLIASAEKSSRVGRVVVGLLGDFIDGNIHPDTVETALLGPGPALAFAKQLLSRGIRYLLDQHPSIEFSMFCTGGNHARITTKTRINTNAENNLESYMYHHLASDFRDDSRAKFHIAEGDDLYSDVFPDYRVRWLHGDAVSYQGGVGGLTIPLNKYVLRTNSTIRANLSVLGHFHQCKADRDWLVNGSLIGYNMFAKRMGFAFEPPQQIFALIHSKHGRTSVSNIWCQE